MSNVLSEENRQKVIALGRLGWPLRRIEKATGVRRETASGYLKAAGVEIRPPGRWGRRPPAKPANEPSPDSRPISKPANEVSPDSAAPDSARTPVPGTLEESPPGQAAAVAPRPDNKPANEPSPDSQSISKPANEVSPDSAAPGSARTPVPGSLDEPPPDHAPLAARSPDVKPADQPSPDSATVAAPGPSPTASVCEPYRDFIELSLSKGRNAKAIYQDLVDDHGFTARYQSVKRFVRQLRDCSGPQPCAVILTPPGEEAQVDYGSGPMVRDGQTGRYRRTRMFALTLGYSRKAVHLLTFQSSTRIWADLHQQAFHRLGGATRTIVLDNLTEGVLQPDIYDPDLNPLYRDLLTHYGAVALPCRVRDPDRKGKVERSVGHAKNTPLRGLRFESLAEAQAYLDRWEQHWADTRIHGTTKRQVAAMFAQEKPALLPLPLEPFRPYQFGERRVNLDGCVEVDAAYYSAPPGWIGRQVKVQWDGRRVRVLDPRSGQLLREHLRQQRGDYRIPDQDRPAKMLPSTQQLLLRCARLGAHAGALAEHMYRQDGVVSIRRILGLLGLARKHGAALTDDGCAAAMEIGLPANPYRFVRRWLERRPQLTLRQVDPMIRQLTLYRDLIDHKTREDPTE